MKALIQAVKLIVVGILAFVVWNATGDGMAQIEHNAGRKIRQAEEYCDLLEESEGASDDDTAERLNQLVRQLQRFRPWLSDSQVISLDEVTIRSRKALLLPAH